MLFGNPKTKTPKLKVHLLVKFHTKVIIYLSTFIYLCKSEWKKLLHYLKILDFAIFAIFNHFCEIYTRKRIKTTKSRNQIPAKLNPCQVWDSLFPNIWSKYDIDNRTLHISTYSNEIRVSETYLITIEFINNRKTDIQWDFRFFYLLKSQN